MKAANGFVRGVLAIRIYFDENSATPRTPMADLLMVDHVVETIEWTNVKQREQFEEGINGYTLIYDERPKMPWAQMVGHE